MRTLMMAAGVSALALLAAAGHAQEAPAAPPAEMKQLDFLLGAWSTEGTFSNMGMTGKLSGTVTYRATGGSHFMVRESAITLHIAGMSGPMQIEELTIIHYDSAAKKFQLDVFDLGHQSKGTGTVERGSFIILAGPESGVAPMSYRVTTSPDGSTALQSVTESTADGGKTWSTVIEQKYTKAAAPK